jgi:hypothetical protein
LPWWFDDGHVPGGKDTIAVRLSNKRRASTC